MLTARLTMPLEIACTMIFVVAGSSMLAAAKPNIVHIVADDLGYNDLGIRNGGKTFTPVIDDLIRNGVTLSSYYTFRVCAPTRASIMTGRYPWGVGYYDMSDDMHHCVDPKYQMTPAVLKSLGYETHAIGKYDVGFVLRHCLPTYRGFDDFFGYYTACTSDYWMHGAPGGSDALGHCNDIDFHDSVGANISGAVMHGPNSVNNTYDQVLFTERAVHHINAFAANQNTDGAASGLYIYLAYHNVHDTCSKNREKAGLGAPRDTVERYATTTQDTWKVQGAMTTELDYGVGNVTAALKATGLYANTVLILVSDNGGPLQHSTNAPLRGGKATQWEGGVRVEAFVHSPLLPVAVRGSVYPGMMHSSDWYVTCIVGIAGGAFPANTGPRPPDGHNMWPALTGQNLTSPRTEVIHAVQNKYFNGGSGHCEGCPPNVNVASARFGDYKIILSGNRTYCDSAQPVVAWPTPGDSAVPFGLSGGVVRNGTDWAYAPLLKTYPMATDVSERHGDPTCQTGIPYANSAGSICCLKSCTRCGCPGGVPYGPGGNSGCCVTDIVSANQSCATHPPPCVMGPPPKPGCLFNVVTDLNETHNLRNDPAYLELFDKLVAMLQERADTGPPLASAFPLGEKNKTADEVTCATGERTGVLFPVDY
eukprot:m.326588 g.326588  ORF g.326588 m.326588 type:complete len:648 (+) comp20409_c0_seq2:213-2156(+)